MVYGHRVIDGPGVTSTLSGSQRSTITARTMRAVDLTRVTVAAVVDNRPPFNEEVVLLFASLERFGGAMRHARRRAYFIGDAPAATERQLAGLGVEVHVREPVIDRFRIANKLRMFEPREHDDTDLLVALDTDILVSGDFATYLDRGVVQAKQVDRDALPLALWEQLFAFFGLDLPTVRFATSIGADWTHAYFNAGVLLVPGPLLAGLHARWLGGMEALLERPDELADVTDAIRESIPQYHLATTTEDLFPLVFADQWAFSLAVHALRAPYAVLPLAMNFPTPCAGRDVPARYLRERFQPAAVRPLLLHHHHGFDRCLPPTGYDAPDRVIAQVNEFLAEMQPHGG